jgi:hypothetical protein
VMLARQPMEVSVSSILSSTQLASLGYFPDHLTSWAARSRCPGEVMVVVQPAQLL